MSDGPEEKRDEGRPADGPPEPPGERPRFLRRSRTDRVVAGVAGGLGHYFGIDPVLVRIGFVILVLAGGSGILIYLIAWLVMPAAAAGEEPAERSRVVGGESLPIVLGGALIALGGIILATRFIPNFTKVFWPLAVVAAGVAVVVQAMRR